MDPGSALTSHYVAGLPAAPQQGDPSEDLRLRGRAAEGLTRASCSRAYFLNRQVRPIVICASPASSVIGRSCLPYRRSPGRACLLSTSPPAADATIRRYAVKTKEHVNDTVTAVDRRVYRTAAAAGIISTEGRQAARADTSGRCRCSRQSCRSCYRLGDHPSVDQRGAHPCPCCLPEQRISAVRNSDLGAVRRQYAADVLHHKRLLWAATDQYEHRSQHLNTLRLQAFRRHAGRLKERDALCWIERASTIDTVLFNELVQLLHSGSSRRQLWPGTLQRGERDGSCCST